MRLVQRHAIAGATVAVAATVAVLVSGAGQGLAEPAPTLAVPASSSAAADPALTDRSDHTNRDADRPDLGAARQTALGQQGKAITKAAATAKAAAKKKADAKKKAEQARVAKLGYDPKITDPREMARQIMKNKFGYGETEFRCVDNIVMRESMWSVTATNPSSGAYGIPQSLPGNKMATIAADWRTNPATQITWMIHYLQDRYGGPCNGWAYKAAHGVY